MENSTNQPIEEKIVYKYEGVSILDWMLTLLVGCIPIVNFIVYLVWANSFNTHPSKAEYCKLLLWCSLIAFVLLIIAVFAGRIIIGGSLGGPFAGDIRL